MKWNKRLLLLKVTGLYSSNVAYYLSTNCNRPAGGLFSALPNCDIPATTLLSTVWANFTVWSPEKYCTIIHYPLIGLCPGVQSLSSSGIRLQKQSNDGLWCGLTSPLYLSRSNVWWWFCWHSKAWDCRETCKCFCWPGGRFFFFFFLPRQRIQHALCPTSHDAPASLATTKRTLCGAQTHRLSSAPSLLSILSLLLPERVTPAD